MNSDERLLSLLQTGEFVSGEQIAERLGVSRAAVAKRVAELRRRGFHIAAAPRRGYRLDATPDALTADVVGPKLTTEWLGRAWRHHAIVGSTNDEAAAWARATPGAPAGAVVVADAQEQGRGRLGRRWHSPPAESLYLSVVLRPPLPPHRVPPLTLGRWRRRRRDAGGVRRRADAEVAQRRAARRQEGRRHPDRDERRHRSRAPPRRRHRRELERTHLSRRARRDRHLHRAGARGARARRSRAPISPRFCARGWRIGATNSSPTVPRRWWPRGSSTRTASGAGSR